LTEDGKLRVFNNRMLRRIFGPKRDELTGEWRRLHNKELAGHIAHRGERRGSYWALVGKPEGRRPLRRPRHRWVDNVKIDLRKVGWGS
jgi:hypothetical protein